ncbi:MAG: phenylalanine--tRNA ligase subunit alpha [Firmicutes bacterium]|nr:phenylalanine--tRNA ligase subunit alpha [Bacillota bacterium]
MLEKQEMIRKSFASDLDSVTNTNMLNELKVKYLGKKGLITELTSNMKDLSIDERKEVGRVSNELKNELNEKINSLESELKLKELNQKLESEKIDISLPATKVPVGAPNVLEKLIEEVEELLMSMGYDVVDGPEIEEDKFNFEMLNIPKGHPARDAQDTFYIKDEEILLRSQTSPVQARTMLKGEGKTPIRMICPGKTYRRDDDDATHSHQFMQIEGLLVDKNISLSDLKGTFDAIAKKLFGEDCKTRFRPSYYQFTEPSVETDISCFVCKGEGCSLCKNTGWITVSGAGMVHPNVLRNCGYDPEEWTGFAFGFGAERLAMLKYGINDIRFFYQTDLRELSTFDRKDSE